MLNKIQKEHLLWPLSCSGKPTTPAGKVGRFDRVIGLVPQSVCLFKQFQYETDIIAKDDIAGCVENELKTLVEWPDYDFYYLVNEISHHWQVSVWIWQKQQAEFADGITHIVPAMAYYLGMMNATGQKSVLFYKEDNATFTCTVSALDVIERIGSLRMAHQRHLVLSCQRDKVVCFTNDAEHIGIDLEWSELKPNTSWRVLQAGKRADKLDLTNPVPLYRAVGVLSVLWLGYMGLDYAWLNSKHSAIKEEVNVLQAEVQDVLDARSHFQDVSKNMDQINAALNQQQQLVGYLDELLKALSPEVVIERISYKDRVVTLRGAATDSNQFLESLTSMNTVDTARLLGEITFNNEGMQVFRAEVRLKNS
ncbi:PilN domain-containing protein [Oceanimonas smirnovii]|uniref:PilN domain-containing protein n=1 Tax=Oceanimonas smirnovii TaxID=264574 RepID=UPI003FD5668B